MRTPLILFILLLLTACSPRFGAQPEPSDASAALPSLTNDPSPSSAIHTETPTVPPTPTPDPRIVALRNDIELILPSDSDPLISRAWIDEDSCYDLIIAVPYHQADVQLSLIVLGIPRGPEGSLKEGEPYLIWDWSESTPVLSALEEIRSLEQGSVHDNLLPFLARNGEGDWQLGLHYGRCGDPTPYFTAWAPVEEPGVFQIFAGRFRPEDPYNIWIQQDDGLVKQYRIDDGEAIHDWTLQDSPGILVGVRGDERTGNDDPKLRFIWDIAGELWDEYFLQVDAGLRHLALVKRNWQRIDLDQDGVDEFLRPDNFDNPSSWDVYRLGRDQYEWVESLARPMAPDSAIPELSALPPIAADLYLVREERWYRWPMEGGTLVPVDDVPDSAPSLICDQMSLLEVSNCISPDGRYQLVSLPHTVEGGSVGIRNRASGTIEEIPGTFVYTVGHNEFSWDPNGTYLLHAQANGSAGLKQILLPSREIEVLLSFETDRLVYGAVQPAALPDGSILFAIQSGDNFLYPPNGIYRYFPDTGQLNLVAQLPPLYPPEDIQSSPTMLPLYDYGQLNLSPDSSSFFFVQGDYWSESTDYQAFLIVDLEAGLVWDALPILGVPDHPGHVRWALE